jgi:undecaprenyl-diphosphatase
MIEGIVLGAVQGLTEFIPISSSGHLVIVPALFDWRTPSLAFDVLLHAASLVALIAYFWADLVDLGRGAVAGDREPRRLVLLLVVGTIPAAVAGVALNDLFERQFQDARGAALQLLITAVILVGAELILRYHVRRRSRLRDMGDLDLVDAVAIGVAQAVAIVPGISRSGATIGTGLARAVTREASARFAFLLAIPALAGASVVEIPELAETTLDAGAAIAGFGASLVFSYAAIAGLIRYLRTRTLYPFAAYCVVASVVFYVLL